MSAARKTIEVARVREKANHYLAASTNGNVDQRWGTIGLVEAVLHLTGNYKGFTYLASEYNTGPDSEGAENAPRLRKGYDDTRRRYL